MRICIIGPVYPYKGGISHYTGMMVRSLKREHEVFTVSYKMQYPKIMYKKEQRDYNNKTFEVEDAQYLLNTANPFNIIRTAHKIKEFKPDLIITQWWHPYFSPCYMMLRMFIRKIPIVYLCHNVFPHERFPMDKFLTQRVLKKSSGCIVHSEKEARDLLAIKPNSIYEVTPHPTYNAFKIQNMTKEDARATLDISADRKMLLFFGFVREYKGLKHLLKAMPEVINNNKDIILYVVGDFAGDKDDYTRLSESLGLEQHIVFIDGYIPDNEVEKYFSATDLVVLPYESATQSGIVQIAYGFNKPCIVTKVGGLPEVVIDGKTGYVVEPQKPEAIAEAINRYFDLNKEKEFSSNVAGEEYKYSWDRMNEVVNRISYRINNAGKKK